MKRIFSLLSDESGAISVLTVLLMVVFVGLLALVIDLGHLHTVQSELRNAADACALRGARAFFPDTITGVVSLTPDPNRARSEASLTIRENKWGEKDATRRLTDLPIGEIEAGTWDYEKTDPQGPLDPWVNWDAPSEGSLYYGKKVGPAISLPVKVDESHNAGPVNMTLAKLFGKPRVPVKVKATAALSGWGGSVPGTPVFPGGPSLGTLPPSPGDYHATMRNDGTDTFGWSSLNPDGNTNTADIMKMLKDPTGAHTPDCPPGSEPGIQNGVAAAAIKTMTAPNNMFGLVEMPARSGIYLPDTAHAGNVYILPVFSKDTNKFNQSSIIGSIPVQIIRVTTSPENSIDFKIMSDASYVTPGYGGGIYFGVWSAKPFLVQ